MPAHHTTDYNAGSLHAYTTPAVRHETGIGDLIKQQITIFLIGIATQKLQQFLEGAGKDNREPIRKHDTTRTEPLYLH